MLLTHYHGLHQTTGGRWPTLLFTSPNLELRSMFEIEVLIVHRRVVEVFSHPSVIASPLCLKWYSKPHYCANFLQTRTELAGYKCTPAGVLVTGLIRMQPACSRHITLGSSVPSSNVGPRTTPSMSTAGSQRSPTITRPTEYPVISTHSRK